MWNPMRKSNCTHLIFQMGLKQ
uniref:Uncharacterized protein n=1 Tax=Rhizophora mucronata TaxID=61149 RepID=A0A2P2PVY5_RHIMU